MPAPAGRELSLHGLPTWWCGEAAAWADTREDIGDRVVRATYREGQRYFEPVIGRDLDAAGLAAWRERIEADPDAHTLQERLAFSQAPVWQGGRIEPRTALVRVYAIADPQGGWHVLPGGLTRVSAGDPHFVSMQQGSSSLDTWVLTDGPVDTFSMLRAHAAPEELALRRRPVASRTAENLFWMGRYTERCEHLVQLAQACADLVEDDDERPDAVRQAMSTLAVESGLAPWGVPTLVQSPRLFERAVVAALKDGSGETGACSVAWNLAALMRCASALRDRLSPAHWRLISAMRGDFGRRLRELSARTGLSSPAVQDAFELLAEHLAAVTGAQSDRMTRDDGWRLLTIGRLSERLVLMTSVLEAFCLPQESVQPEGLPALATLQGFDLALALFDSTITFRARYQRRNDLLALMDLLVLDEANPRALACVLRRLRTEIAKLPCGEGTTGNGIDHLLSLLPAQGCGLELADLLAAAEAADANDHGVPAGGVLAPVGALAQRLHGAALMLTDEIGRRYFAHADGFDRIIL